MRPILTQDGFEALPLDRERWESSVDRWRQVEDQFPRQPAEAVRQAERLFLDLTGQQEASPSSIVRAVMRLSRSSAGANRTTFTSDADLFASAIVDLVRGVPESYRRVRQAQAAKRGITAARDHRDASVDDLQEAMQMFRRLFERILDVKREDLDAFAGAKVESGPAGQRAPESPVTEARERVIAQRIVRESMRVTEQAEARADRWRTVRWGVMGLVGNIVFGLAILLVVIWVLSLQ